MAIAISTDVYDRMQRVGEVGGIVGNAPRSTLPPPRRTEHPTGASVSATFLFIVGLANSIILYRILRDRRRVRAAPQLASIQLSVLTIVRMRSS